MKLKIIQKIKPISLGKEKLLIQRLEERAITKILFLFVLVFYKNCGVRNYIGVILTRENQGVFNKNCGIQRRQLKDAPLQCLGSKRTKQIGVFSCEFRRRQIKKLALQCLEERARENQGVFSYAN